MACRKNAYRALTEVSEWNEKQQAESAARYAIFEEQQRKLWTPAEVADKCCLPWLADGQEMLGHQNTHTTKGCNGACGKEHPRVTLDLDGSQAVAQLSHPLDPFVKYFAKLCLKELATKKTPEEYHLKGGLEEHVDRLKEHEDFGYHLVRVSPSALSASRRLQERQMEEEEDRSKAKRRRIEAQLVDQDLLESAFDICANHCFLDHINLAEISWMRTSNHFLANYGARLARIRLQNVRFSYSLLLNGMWTRVDEVTLEKRSSEGQILDPKQFLGTRKFSVEYDVKISHAPLSLSETGLVLKPKENAAIALGKHVVVESEHFRYRGHLLRVYLEASEENDLPEADCMFSEPLEIARYKIDPRKWNVPKIFSTLSTATNTNKLEYEVTNLEQHQAEPDSDGKVTMSGSFKIESIDFNFGDLLGIFARRKLRVAKQQLQDPRRKHPASRSEKLYVKALAKTSRESPGNAEAFDHMQGWKR